MRNSVKHFAAYIDNKLEKISPDQEKRRELKPAAGFIDLQNSVEELFKVINASTNSMADKERIFDEAVNVATKALIVADITVQTKGMRD